MDYEPRRLMTFKAIAGFIGVSERTARNYAARGMPVYRVGRGCRVWADASEIDRWMRGEKRS